MTTDEKILQELYRYAEDLLADSNTASGDYYASDLAEYSITIGRVKSSRYGGGYETGLKHIDHKKNYNTLFVYNDGHIIDNDIKISVDNFSCSFRARDIFTFILWYEKLCGVTGKRRKLFHVPPEEELAA